MPLKKRMKLALVETDPFANQMYNNIIDVHVTASEAAMQAMQKPTNAVFMLPCPHQDC